MLTDKDIDRLLQVLATKEDVRMIVREETADLRQTMHDILTAVDRLAKSIEDLAAEYAAVKEQLSRHERWIRQIAKKAGVHLTDD